MPKTYAAKIKGQLNSKSMEKLKKGVWLAEGKTSGGAVKILNRGHEESLVEITIRQGLNRQVRRMLAKVGLPVKSLHRTRIGNLTAQGVPIGKFRELTKAEIAYLLTANRNSGQRTVNAEF